MDLLMFIVESTDPYSAHPHLTDQRHECANVDEAADRFAELTDWSEDDAREALAEGNLKHVDQETGREVTATRVASPAALLVVQQAAARTMLEVAEARVRMAHPASPDTQFALVTARDDARAVAEEMGVFEVIA
jgi:hypothetical protein